MSKRTFLVSVILTNLAFVLILLHKRNAVTEELYTKQRYEQELHLLAKQEHALQHELCNLQDRNTVKTYAQTYLNMSPVTLAQMKKISS
jgi:cell division protein FtsB